MQNANEKSLASAAVRNAHINHFGTISCVQDMRYRGPTGKKKEMDRINVQTIIDSE